MGAVAGPRDAHRHDAASRPTPEAAEAGGRVGTTVEVAVPTALARDAAGDRDQALESLRLALAVAQPEAWVRVIAEDAEGLRSLLDEVERLDGASHFLADVRAAAGAPASPAGAPPRGGRSGSPRSRKRDRRARRIRAPRTSSRSASGSSR